jgi:hypothetical protein
LGWRVLELEVGVEVADASQLLEAQGHINHTRFRQPGGDYLHADRKTVAARSEPHRQGAMAAWQPAGSPQW